MKKPIEFNLTDTVQRIERLEEEKFAIMTDINALYAEAKENGTNIKALKKVIADRKLDRQEVLELREEVVQIEEII